MTPATSRQSPADAAVPRRPPSRGGLWQLAAGPLVWAAHLLFSYATAAIWCARAATPEASLGGARNALLAYTAVALVAIAWLGWRGFRRHRRGDATPPHDAPTAGDRARFLGFATMLLCGLSFVAVAYAGLAALAIGSCR